MSGIVPSARAPYADVSVPGPVLQRHHVPLLTHALGCYSSGEPFWSRVDSVQAYSPGLYLALDAKHRILWLGKASGAQGVTGRIRKHLTEPWKREAFHWIWVAPAYDQIPDPALKAAEGWAAEALDLRTKMPHRTWPSSAGWLPLVSRQRVA